MNPVMKVVKLRAQHRLLSGSGPMSVSVSDDEYNENNNGYVR